MALGLSGTALCDALPAEQLPFGDASFDVVIFATWSCISCPTRRWLVIEEAARVLRPRGRLILVDFAPHDATVLGPEHAHRWPGFSGPGDRSNGWAEGGRSGRQAARWRLPGGPLTVKAMARRTSDADRIAFPIAIFATSSRAVPMSFVQHSAPLDAAPVRHQQGADEISSQLRVLSAQDGSDGAPALGRDRDAWRRSRPRSCRSPMARAGRPVSARMRSSARIQNESRRCRPRRI